MDEQKHMLKKYDFSGRGARLIPFQLSKFFPLRIGDNPGQVRAFKDSSIYRCQLQLMAADNSFNNFEFCF